MSQEAAIYNAKNQFGQYGHIYLTFSDVSSEYGVYFGVISALSQSIISYTDATTGQRYTSKTIGAGATICGVIRDVVVTSGEVICYITQRQGAIIPLSIDSTSLVDIWLVAGQSNVDGRVALSDGSTPAYLKDPQPDFYMFNGTDARMYSFSSVSAAGNGSSFSNETASQNKWSFAEVALYQLAQTTRRKIIVCRVSNGGTSISISASSSRGCWNVDYESIPGSTTKLLQELNTRYDALTAYLDSNGISYVTRGMMWHQGEQDTSDAANYETNFGNVIDEVRSFTGNAALPIYYGTISEASTAYNATINAAQLSLADADANLYCRNNAALTLYDTVHFDGASLITFGDWIADQII